MSFDDAEEKFLDEQVQELLEDASLEQLERQMSRYFGTTDIDDMPEGRVKRAIVYARFNRLMNVAMTLTVNLEAAPHRWKSDYPSVPEIELGRGLER
jgi:hypothetical protein